MAVTLVIKTPSLKLSDLTYSCDASTSVLQLKTYLENQYPSKPKPDEQRLIYQGRLLRDHEVLHDFLRDLDSEQRHTLHLVYTLKRTLSAENRELSTGMFAAGVPPANTTDDGLRQRHNVSHQTIPTVPTASSGGAVQPPAEWVTNAQFPAVWANQAGADPVTQQMLWWQQTYAQHYWAQYMQQYNSQGPHHQAGPHDSTPAPVPNVPQAAAVGPDPGRPVQPEEQQQQQRRPPMAAVGGVAQDEDDEGGIRAARDWLDWIYVGSRLAILLGVMYYYSSLPRFMLVTLIVAGIYLYQKAIHQRRHIAPPPQRPHGLEVNNNGGPAAEAPPPAQPVVAAPVPAPVAAQAPADVNAEPVAVANAADRAPGAVVAAQISPTAFNVALNVLIGFFSSLIPEVPAPEALN